MYSMASRCLAGTRNKGYLSGKSDFPIRDAAEYEIIEKIIYGRIAHFSLSSCNVKRFCKISHISAIWICCSIIMIGYSSNIFP